MSQDDSVGFIFMGDWGYAGNQQINVAEMMGRYADNTENDIEFIIALGDNFYKQDSYHDGVHDDTDSQWKDLYSSVYTQSSLQIPWYVVLGNHDYHGNPDAQISFYKNKRDNRWTMPDHCYNQRWYNKGSKDPLLEIIFIDTTILSPNIIKETSAGGAYEAKPSDISRHLDSIEKMLSQSRAKWLLVSGHYTIYTAEDEDDRLISSLVPLLKKYGVQAYIDGHDHSMQYISYEGVEYMVSGTGSKPKYHMSMNPKAEAADGVRFTTLSAGFGSAFITKTSAEFSFIDTSGNAMFTRTLTNPRTMSNFKVAPELIDPTFYPTSTIPIIMFHAVIMLCMLSSTYMIYRVLKSIGWISPQSGPTSQEEPLESRVKEPLLRNAESYNSLV